MTFPSTPAAAALARGRGLQRLQVPQRDRSALQEIGDQHARRSIEPLEQVAQQAAAKLALLDRRGEQLRVADFLDLAQRTLLLEAIDERLHRGIGDAFLLGQAIENLAHRAGAELPALLEDAGLGL